MVKKQQVEPKTFLLAALREGQSLEPLVNQKLKKEK